jgi:hypothetical protein
MAARGDRHALPVVTCVAVTFLCLASSASATPTGTLALSSAGLPKGQQALVRISGDAAKRTVRFSGHRPLILQAGHYVLAVQPVTIGSSLKGVESGATAYPTKKRLKVTVQAGARTVAVAGYVGVVNPATRQLPGTALGFLGDPDDPSAVLLSARRKSPGVGTIFVSGSSGRLPRGLISRVAKVTRKGSEFVTHLEAVPITEAVPNLAFEGTIDFQPVDTSASARLADAPAHASSACSPPKLLKFGAHLDSFELRQASLGAWPPQMRLTLAIRTTESMGMAAVAAGVNCDWSLKELGPYEAAIPVGPIVVPVYATIPVKAGVHINGKLNAVTINVASTTVASTAAGFDDNHATLSQQGSNIWTSGVLSLSGSAKLSASVGVQAGVGVAKGANVHLNAGFGPEFEWSSGSSCDVYADLGSLSAGVAAFGKHLDTPSWTPIRPRLWSGCPAGGGSTGRAGGGGDGQPGGSPGGAPGGPGTGGGTPPGGGGGKGMSWHAIEFPVPAGGEAGSGSGVGRNFACSADGTCVVAGDYTEGSNERWMIDTLSDGSWGAVQTPVPTGGEAGSGWTPSYFLPVCSADGTCVVTGEYKEGGVERGMIDILSGGSWSAIEVPVPTGGVAGSGDLIRDYADNPACSADICVLPGIYRTAGGEEDEMIDTLSGGSWSAIGVPVPAGGVASSAYVNAPACSADDNCVVTGSYLPTGDAYSQGMIDTLSGGHWSAIAMPVPVGGVGGSGGANSAGAACSADDTCVVAGGYEAIGGEGREMVDTLSDGSWGAVETPVPAGGTLGGTSYSTCSAGDTCVLPGSYRATGGEQLSMIDTLSGGSWSAVEAPVPAGGTRGGLESNVPTSACAADGTCVLPGIYRTAGGEEDEMIDTLSGGSWSAVDAPGPGVDVGDTNFYPACAADGPCIVTGGSIIDILSGGSWSWTYMAVPAGGVGAGWIEGADPRPTCSADGTCLEAGVYEMVGGGQRAMIAVGESLP